MAAEDLSEELVNIGDSQLNMRCIGQGSPTVVIEPGLGEGLDPWIPVQNEVATFTRVVAYDRAGAGKSSPGPLPRTSQRMVRELHAMLSQAHIDGPYLLVGHSLGGLNMQLFAREYPQEVAGMVLLDPTLTDQVERMQQVWGNFRSSLLNQMTFAAKSEGMTFKDMAASCQQVIQAGKLPDVPLTIISAGKPLPLPAVFRALFPQDPWLKIFQEGHITLAGQSNQGSHQFAVNSHHMSIGQDPAVVPAIQNMVIRVNS